MRCLAGMVNVRQRPGSAKGVIFLTIEDKSGDANVVVWESVEAQYKQAIHNSSLILITGYIQKEGDVVHLIARSVVDLSHMLASIGDRNVALQAPHQPCDELRNDGPGEDLRVTKVAQIQRRSWDIKRGRCGQQKLTATASSSEMEPRRPPCGLDP